MLKLGSRNGSRKWAVAILLSIFVQIVTTTSAHSGFIEGKLGVKPPKVTELRIYFIDLSESLDPSLLNTGIVEMVNRIGEVYDKVTSPEKSPAAYHIKWVPIRGSDMAVPQESLFTESTDQAIWDLVADSDLGPANQRKMLAKIRNSNGLWSVIIKQKLTGRACFMQAAKTLGAPGVNNRVLGKVSTGICLIARKSLAKVVKLKKTVQIYGKNGTYKATNSDILGAYDKTTKATDALNSQNTYNKIRYLFISDMIQNTSKYDLKNIEQFSEEQACELAKSNSEDFTKLSSNVSVNIYAIGELNENNSKNVDKSNSKKAQKSEAIRKPLESYWKCFFKQVNSGSLKFAPAEEFRG